MTGRELQALWEVYPEIRSLYEQYRDITVEDDRSWSELVGSFDLLRKNAVSGIYLTCLLETVRQLENIARKRKGTA